MGEHETIRYITTFRVLGSYEYGEIQHLRLLRDLIDKKTIGVKRFESDIIKTAL